MQYEQQLQMKMETSQVASEQKLSLWQLIKSDLDRYRVTDERNYLTMLIMCPGSLACITHRIGHWLWYYTGPFSFLMPILRALHILISRFFIEIITGIWIAPKARIGPGLYIGHWGGVLVGSHVVMGSNCNLSPGITIGRSSRGDTKGNPVIGDRVYIATGAKVFGKIEIGNDVAIGANAVVTKSLPERAVAVGIPARVVSCKGSFEYVLYQGMETDPERLASLAVREQSEKQRTGNDQTDGE